MAQTFPTVVKNEELGSYMYSTKPCAFPNIIYLQTTKSALLALLVHSQRSVCLKLKLKPRPRLRLRLMGLVFLVTPYFAVLVVASPLQSFQMTALVFVSPVFVSLRMARPLPPAGLFVVAGISFPSG
jgi:hypothetical protein